MRILFSALLMAASISTFALAKKADESFKVIHVKELAQWVQKDANAVHIYDANNESTRKKDGIIPNATLLTSSSEYDTSVLPAEKDAKLVFYCANTACTASHEAAKRATGAGYTSVYVMADGIKGWKSAKQKTAAFPEG